jgi:hypothetical protein
MGLCGTLQVSYTSRTPCTRRRARNGFYLHASSDGTSTYPGYVVQIKGNYYGAKQGPKLFSDDLKHNILVSDYSRNSVDACIYVVTRNKGTTQATLVVTVDAFIGASSDH